MPHESKKKKLKAFTKDEAFQEGREAKRLLPALKK
jgi:hypothetical protein